MQSTTEEIATLLQIRREQLLRDLEEVNQEIQQTLLELKAIGVRLQDEASVPRRAA
jgi:hypothetical protein